MLDEFFSTPDPFLAGGRLLDAFGPEIPADVRLHDAARSEILRGLDPDLPETRKLLMIAACTFPGVDLMRAIERYRDVEHLDDATTAGSSWPQRYVDMLPYASARWSLARTLYAAWQMIVMGDEAIDAMRDIPIPGTLMA
jgi:hypothetical protein